MNVVWTGFCFEYFDTFPIAQLPQYFPDCRFLSLVKHLSSILWRKYDVVFAIPFRSVYKELHADHETGAADNK